MDYKESDMNYYLVPAELGQSKKIAKLLLYLGIEPYDKVTGGSDFIKANFPKMVNLIGSGGYKNNGTFVLGTAEGGVKITLYFINSLNTFINNIDALNEYYFKTIHHEFGHILHQTVPYSPNFKTISGTDYVSDAWSDKYKGGEDVSLPDGFITPYASNQVDDDFVEMLSVYIVNSPEAWAAKMAKAGSKGRSKLLQKLDILTKYMEETWNIDINALRDEIVSRQANISYINF
jgi:substrate import-associated zinc metallohydrolase lipoprotein